MDAACLYGSHPSGPGQNALLDRIVEMLLESRFDLALETDRSGIVWRDFKLLMDFAPGSIESGEDHPQRLGESRRRVFVVGGQPGQAAIPGWTGHAPALASPY